MCVGGGGALEGVGRDETLFRIYCMKKSLERRNK